MNEREVMETMEQVQIQHAAIQKNWELLDEYRQIPLSINGYKILKALNNHEPEKGDIKTYSRNKEDAHISIFIRSLKRKIDISEDEFTKELKVLFLKRYVDYGYSMDNEFKRRLEKLKIDDLDDELMKFGTALDISCTLEGNRRFRLTNRGFVVMVNYALREMHDLKEEVETSIAHHKNQLNELNNKQTEIDKSLNSATENLDSTKQHLKHVEILSKKASNNAEDVVEKISKFNENIFTIFSLMIAAFAVIGININIIPEIKDDFLLKVLTINLSICFSLLVLFHVLKVVVYNEKKTGLGRWILGILAILLLIIIIQSGYWTKIYNSFNQWDRQEHVENIQ